MKRVTALKICIMVLVTTFMFSGSTLAFADKQSRDGYQDKHAKQWHKKERTYDRSRDGRYPHKYKKKKHYDRNRDDRYSHMYRKKKYYYRDRYDRYPHKYRKKKYYYRERYDRYSHDRYRSGIYLHVYFGSRHREVIRNYYARSFRRGYCPPGLVKRNNRCMAPGQVKKWYIGRPLPRDVHFYDLPYELVVQLGGPFEGHRFVRVASDILLIAIGTGIVIDAIQDLDDY